MKILSVDSFTVVQKYQVDTSAVVICTVAIKYISKMRKRNRDLTMFVLVSYGRQKTAREFAVREKRVSVDLWATPYIQHNWHTTINFCLTGFEGKGLRSKNAKQTTISLC